MSVEPETTAALLVTVGLMLTVSVVLARLSGRSGMPVALLFLVVGIAAGARGNHGIDHALAFRLGTLSLVVILFDGGLNTPLQALREGLKPALVLATVGVAGTAALTALGGHALGLAWGVAALLGAVVSSTDAAQVFAVLRSSGIRLKRRVGATLEVESGLNDPVAVVLTLGLTHALASGGLAPGRLLAEGVRQLLVGAAVGAALGACAVLLLRRLQLPAGGLYPVLTLAVALLAFGLATLAGGSGVLSVYLAGLVVGNQTVRYKASLHRVHDALAWLAQVGMLLVLGLLADPAQLAREAPLGLALGLLLTTLARPLVVAACLAPFRYRATEVVYIGWVGLRGAVPIVLATYPVLVGAPGAERIFHLAFFVVVVNAFVPGWTVAWLTRRLGLVSRSPPPPPAVLEIASTHLVKGEVVSFYIAPASAAAGARLSELPLPETATVMLVVRGAELVAPRGETALDVGDHLYIACRSEDLPLLDLLLGRQEDD